MSKIAIQGHHKRRKDVIKTLESLGGINCKGYVGYETKFYYYINTENFIDCDKNIDLPQGYKKYTLEEYEQIQSNMEKRNIQIDIVTAKQWYKQGGDLRKIALQAFSEQELQELPKSWEEYCKVNIYLDVDKETIISIYGRPLSLSNKIYYRKDYPNALVSEKRAKQFLTLNKLLQIRDYYNQGWTPDWTASNEDKYVITTNKNELYILTSWFTNYIFTFKTRELRDEFFQNFKEDLEFIKEFL